MKHKLIFICLIATFSCKKYNKIQSDANGDSHIRGRLFLYDTLTKNVMGNPFPGKTVQLFYNDSKDSINYLLSSVTDKEGYFTFKNLDLNSSYRIYYEEKTDSNIIYTAERIAVKPPFDTLSLNAFLNPNKEPGLHYTIKDSSGAPVKGASICIYGNAAFFQPGICNNSSYSLTTDANGHAFVFDIPSVTFYTTAYISVNGTSYIVNDMPTVGSSINFRTLTLGKVKQTGYIYHIVDESGAAIPGANLCFFTSSLFSNNGGCDGSNFQDTSNGQGIAKGTSVIPNTYYVNTNIKIDSVSFFGRDTIKIVKDSITSHTITLMKK